MRVGFIGLGTMGSSMAANMVAAGHDLTVHDLDQARVDTLAETASAPGAGSVAGADSAAAVAAASEVVLTSLPGPAEVEAVALGPDGLADGARSGTAYFDLTTSSPLTIRAVADRLAPIGVDVFDAPVSGGPDGARSGRLAVWVGGDEAAFARWAPVLSSFADAPRLVGDLGAGSVAKLVHNLSGYIMNQALAETFTLGVKAGVSPDGLWEALRQGAIGRRRTFDTLNRNFLPGEFDPPAFALELARKDVGLACELGRELDVPMRLANLTLQELTEAVNRGWGGRDSRAAMLLQEERAGVECRITPERIAEILED